MGLSFGVWLRQPSTIMGIGAALAAAASVLAQVMSGDLTIAAGAGVAAFSLTHLLISDNTAAPTAMRKLVSDIVADAMDHHLTSDLPTLIGDAAAAVMGMQKVSAGTAAPAVAKTDPGPSMTAGAAARVAVVLVALIGLGGLASCSADQLAAAQVKTQAVAQKVQATIQVACQGDAMVQPVLVPLAAAVVPQLGPLATFDQALVHPAVVAACGALGKPVSLVVSAPAVVVPAAVATPAAQ